MSEYTFVMNHGDGTVLTFEGNKEVIWEVLEDFKTFLGGCGFSHENIENIDYEEKTTSPEWDRDTIEL
jgi:hypothetical protein